MLVFFLVAQSQAFIIKEVVDFITKLLINPTFLIFQLLSFSPGSNILLFFFPIPMQTFISIFEVFSLLLFLEIAIFIFVFCILFLYYVIFLVSNLIVVGSYGQYLLEYVSFVFIFIFIVDATFFLTLASSQQHIF